LFVSFTVSKWLTVNQLMEYIGEQVRTRYSANATSMYYMFNEFQTTMNEEAKLGGVLLPENCLLENSMIEDGSTIYVNAEPIVQQPAQAAASVEPVEQVEENQEEPSNQIHNSPVELHNNDTDRINNLNRINNNIDRYVNSLNNIFNQPVVDIDEQARVMDMHSVMDLFSTLIGRSRGVSMPVQRPINPMERFVSLLQMMQIPILNNNLNNLQDVSVGLHPDDLDKLKSGLYKDLKESNKHKLDTCSICFEQFNDEDECRELKCSHMFHQKCVDHWLNDHITCPVCREETGKGLAKL
jgi:hypothetical protein